MNVTPTRHWLIPLAAGLLIALLGFFVFQYFTLSKNLSGTKAELSSTTAAYEESSSTLHAMLAQATDQNAMLSTTLEQEQKKNGDYEQKVGELTSTVGTLTKLTTIDPQLLAKYSKVYFLNENYVPASLSPIPTSDTYDHARTYQFESDALPFLTSMIEDASSTDIHMRVVSSYRSFGAQSALKTSYRVTYGAGTANSFSADQGYSEHQLGTTIDFTTPILGASFVGFDKSDAYQWLLDNAYQYGFIISYPKSNAYYTYEPWHWRFVGVALATKLHDENKHFYDLDQRTINNYLVNLFDPR